VGSNHVTSDLSMALHTPLNVADTVKLNYGSLLTPTNDLIELPIIGDETNTHEVSLEVVHNVIFARVEETLMILAQFIENSGLKEQMGAGVILTGGFSKMEGIRDLAIATFGSIPVRIAKPIELDGLFDNLRGAEYSSAVGLVLYSASAYTPYEIDVNKKVRHSNEIPVEDTAINFRNNPEIPIVPAQEVEVRTDTMVTLPSKKEKKNDEAGAFSKFWNWATQLF
jgi:cell division protein FtsA